jgi:hypothetical protein
MDVTATSRLLTLPRAELPRMRTDTCRPFRARPGSLEEAMNDLRELLATRATQSDALVLRALREGLATEPARSGEAAALHAQLQGYFALDEAATTRSFASAFRRHADTARALMAMLAEDGEDTVVQLMRSLLEGRPRPTGALAAALQGEAAAQAQSAGAGVKAALDAFAKTALGSPGSSAEMELSLAWGVVEGGLLDRVERLADALAFAHGPAHREAAARTRALDERVARSSIAEMIAALAEAKRPRVLARPSEWDIGHEGAPEALVEVPVRHHWQRIPLGPAEQLGDSPAAQQLKQLYAAANGAALFIPLQHEPHEAGLVLIADSEWEAEREQVMTWITMGDPELPEWAHTLVPIAALNGDASRWVVPLSGPLAGTVMLSNDDVPAEQARYASVAHFVAALRLCPQEVLANGGYVSYVAPDHGHALYPAGYAEGEPDPHPGRTA